MNLKRNEKKYAARYLEAWNRYGNNLPNEEYDQLSQLRQQLGIRLARAREIDRQIVIEAAGGTTVPLRKTQLMKGEQVSLKYNVTPNTQHPSPNTQHPSPNTQHLYINIPQWFASTTYKVDRAEEGYLYFTAPKLEYIERSERSGYNVNYDHIIGGQDIRFRLWRPSLLALRGNEGTLHECRTHRFMTAQQCAYRHFTLSGLHFLGSSYSIGLIRLDGIHTEGFMVEHCHFEAIKGLVLWADETPAITFSDNTVEHCSSSISTSNSCTDTRVERNTFSNCGEDLKQSFCVQCKGKDYYIGHNSFRNFGYGAVGVGEWLGNEKRYESSGVIEHNEAWYDEDYLAHKERHTLMDAGAIYLWSKNDNVDIRYNYIHDIDGMLLNRGIFCDDGACHFNIHDNVIVNIANSYSIDARNCEKKFPGANENNRVERNIVSSAIKFEGSSQGTGAGGGLSSPLPGRGNGCVVSGNVMLCRDGQEPPANIYTRLTVDSPDRRLTFYGAGADGIIVDRQQLERLRRLSAYDSAIKAAKWRYK